MSLETNSSNSSVSSPLPNNEAAIVFCLVLGVVGGIGNSLVIGIRIWKYANKTHETFIIGLAITDILVCIFVMPINVVEMLYEYSFYDSIIGRIIRTVDHMLIFISILIVTEMSFDQYRNICYFTKKKMTPKIAIISMTVAIGVSLILALPVTFVRRLNIDNSEGVFSCQINEDENPINVAYDSILLVLYSVLNVLLVTMYILIGRKIYGRINLKMTIITRSLKKQKTGVPSAGRRKIFEASTKKIVKITFLITLIFILSYLPILILYIHENVTGWYLISPCSLHNPTLAVIERFYGFNHVVNPFIYGFMDRKFRNDIRSLIGKIFPCVCCSNVAN